MRRLRISDKGPRVNDRIRAKQVRLVGPDGAQLGIKSIDEAKKHASDLGLDLVEVAAHARPPVVRIMDYQRFIGHGSDRDPDAPAPSTVVKTLKGPLRNVWPYRRRSLRLIGYWRIHTDLPDPPGSSRLGNRSEDEIAAANAEHRAREARWPDARNFVDATWPIEIRQRVAVYLARGHTLVKYRGLSQCRFCGRNNGSAEFTDGRYVWPEGLAHYVDEHDVRLPEEFIEHALASPGSHEEPTRCGTCADTRKDTLPEFDHLGQRVSDRHLENLDNLDLSNRHGEVKINHTWWLKRQQL